MDCTLPIYEGIMNAFPEAELVSVLDIMVSLRSIKSENELRCIREGFRIIEIATDEVIRALKPGVTELAMVGVAQKAIYENGAEYEGLPMYVFSETSTRHAISRSQYRVIGKGDIVQLNLSAKVDGYSPSIGLPVSMGKLSGEKRRIVEFCLDAHRFTERRIRAGVKASEIAGQFYEFYKEHGMAGNYVYGPCHGTGMIEVEAPADRQAAIDALKRSVRELSDFTDRYLCIETLPRTCLLNTSEEANAIIDSLALPNVGLCADVNHFLKEKSEDAVLSMGARIKTTHISDHDYVDERHWLPGQGTIDWMKLIGALEAIGYNGVFNYEVGNGMLEIRDNYNELFDRYNKTKGVK